MRILTEADVAKLLDPDLAIEAAASAYTAIANGEAQVPLRTELVHEHPKRVVLFMPGLLGERVFGLKVVATAATNQGRDLLATASVLLFDAQSLEPLGLVAADYLTDYRTAAGLAAATRALARPGAETLTIFGAGKLAYPSVRLIAEVVRLRRLIVSSRTAARVEALGDKVSGTPALDHLEIEMGLGPDDAAAEGDIIVTVTSSATPVFDGARVRPGTHINLGGAFRPDAREIDDAAARRASFFLDSETSCRARAGDIVIPLNNGAISERQIKGEIGAVLAGNLSGRTHDSEITVFKSLGNAAQDLALAEAMLPRARLRGLGLEFDTRG